MRRTTIATIALAHLGVLATFSITTAIAADPPTRPTSSSITVLDSAGRVVKTIDPEQDRSRRNAQAVDAEQQMASARADEEQRRKDRVLLGSYTTEAEIDLARNRATSAIEVQVEGTRLYMAALERRRVAFEKAKKDSGKPLPAADEQELARLQKEMEVQAASQLRKQRDLDRVNARYDADKQRWEALNRAPTQTSGAASAVSPK